MVCIEDDMSKEAVLGCSGHDPIVANSFACLSLPVSHWYTRGADELSMRWHDDAWPLARSAKLIDRLSELAPIGVDQATVNPHDRPIVSQPFLRKKYLAEFD